MGTGRAVRWATREVARRALRTDLGRRAMAAWVEPPDAAARTRPYQPPPPRLDGEPAGWPGAGPSTWPPSRDAGPLGWPPGGDSATRPIDAHHPAGWPPGGDSATRPIDAHHPAGWPPDGSAVRRPAVTGGDWAPAWEAGRARAADAAAQVRARLAGRRDPVRRHERRKRWTRRSLVARCIATLGLAWVTMHVDPAPGIELGELFWGTGTVVVGAGAVGAGRRLWRLEHTAPPVALSRPAPLPPTGSAARGALQRLVERERVLADLLAHLGPAADDPRRVAAEAAAALRTHGARVAAVEAARRGAPVESRAGLDAAVTALVRQLDEGMAGYDALVVAAADAVSASATLSVADPVLAQRLTDATDALAGLARGLREVAGG